MPKYVVERNIPGAGKLTPAELTAMTPAQLAATNIQIAFVVPLLCHAYTLYFAVSGYKPLAVEPAHALFSLRHSEVE